METKNVLLAIILSTIVIVSWGTFFAPTPTETEAIEKQVSKNESNPSPSIEGDSKKEQVSRSVAINKSKRIKLENQNIKLSTSTCIQLNNFDSKKFKIIQLNASRC